MSAGDTTPLVRLDGVTRIYGDGPTATVALRDVDLTVERGEMLAVVGPSGSGKSTLLNVIGLLDAPSVGAVWFGGRSIPALGEVEIDRLRSRAIGFVFQDARLIPHLDVGENIAVAAAYQRIARRERPALVTRLIEQVGLGRRARGRPDELSGGERQRVAIARALVGEPDLVVCDEPTGNLDEATSREVLEVLSQLNTRGKTVIIATHDPLVSGYCRRRIRLVDGRIDGAA
ncbi:MAG: ABC transporter ATP-binding protein [Actinomyces sp.]|nr:MAG: ABC transporter ATP-binding protein [Actinomyces sp.]